MCGWHCRCPNCALDNGFLFRGQTDSSCSGEVISRILHHDPADSRHVPEVFDILQDASVAVDAEPGLQAGMHVHVGIGHLDRANLRDALWAYLRHEPLLVKLAAGRFVSQRANNSALRDIHSYTLARWSDNAYSRASECITAIESGATDVSLRDAKEYLVDEHYDCDRHSNLCINTRHQTWEFRLWNSTRAAWRMELHTRLSVAMVDPDVVRALLAMPMGRITRAHAERFMVAIADAGHNETAHLLERQIAYAWERADSAPSSLTCF